MFVFIKIFLEILFVIILCVLGLALMCVCSTVGGQKRALDNQELELQKVVELLCGCWKVN